MSKIKTVPRRVITGLRKGKSIIEEDQFVENVSEHFPGLIISDIWNTQSTPASLGNEAVWENSAFPNTPKKGTYFRYVHIPPDEDLGLSWSPGEQHPMMHQTETLDYIIILSGELFLIMDEGETLLRPGDIVVQRGTNHAWSNRSGKPCIQLAILIDASIT